MLERTSACLDTGVRLSLRAQRRAPKSRRLLHNQFWHQQAPDIELPVWHLASASSSASANVIANANAAPSVPDPQDAPAPFLDFLYPAQTLAFMTRLTHWERWARRNTRLPVLRGYSSLSTNQDSADMTSPLAVDDEEGTPHSELRQLLSSTHTAPYSALDITRAWQLYSRHSPYDVVLHQQMVAFFSRQKQRQASIYALDLFSQLPAHHRSSQTFHAAVAAHLALGHESDAVALHEQASHLPLVGSIGSNLLMAHAVANTNWPLALTVMELFHKYTAESTVSVQPPLLWDQLRTLQNPFDRLDSLIAYRQSHRDDTRLPQLFGSIWNEILSHKARNRTFLTTSQLGHRLRTNIRKIIHRMRLADLDSAENYEKILSTLLSVPGVSRHSDCGTLVVFAYLRYRRSIQFAPSKRLLEKLLHHWKEYHEAFAASNDSRSFVDLESIVSDWTSYHKELNDNAVMIIMDAFSRLGNVDGVRSYAALYKSLHPSGLPDSSKLWPLIYVHAALAKPRDAVKQLHRIKQDFGVEPDLRCWNVALQSFAEANNLPGALDLLEKVLETGLQPDAFSYGPLLSLFAQRGDLDGATALLDVAKTNGVKPTVHMLNSIIVASVNCEDIEGAQRALDLASEAVRAGEAEGALTLCFNTMLVAYALRRDLNATMTMYRRMRTEEIPLDGHSYGALIQALCSFRQTPSAHKILRDVIPRTGLRPMAFHYAIVMAGYINRAMYREALEVQEEMNKAKVRATASTHAIGMKARALLEDSIKGDQTDENGATLPLQHAIDDYKKLLESPGTSPPGNQPLPGFRHESRATPAFDAGFLIYIHGARQSFEAVQAILRMYQEKRSESGENAEATPMRLLTTLMAIHCQAGEYAQTDRYWDLIKSQADQLRLEHPTASDIWARIKKPGTNSVRSKKAVPQIPPALRFTLSRALRYYMISQFAQSSPNKIISTVLELLSTGYALDNTTWNTYIVRLCQATPPRALLAFTLVEKFLIHDWPGWIMARRGFITNRSIRPKKSARAEGLQYIRTRYLRPDQLVPQYRTMVYLAYALLAVRGIESSGMTKQNGQIGQGASEARDIKKQMGSIKEIREKAPRTLHAVQIMPGVFDNLQRILLRKNE